ncbi:MAG TPA: hypothetical protein EYP54_02055, partial [Anaerolineales bacterium]|nr:hypothetical protein [Anaerolineales bacterium]
MPGHPQEDLAALPDRALVERATQGDREAFGVLYQRYVQRIYNYIYYRVGHAVEAEDLTARWTFSFGSTLAARAGGGASTNR